MKKWIDTHILQNVKSELPNKQEEDEGEGEEIEHTESSVEAPLFAPSLAAVAASTAPGPHHQKQKFLLIKEKN